MVGLIYCSIVRLISIRFSEHCSGAFFVLGCTLQYRWNCQFSHLRLIFAQKVMVAKEKTIGRESHWVMERWPWWPFWGKACLHLILSDILSFLNMRQIWPSFSTRNNCWNPLKFHWINVWTHVYYHAKGWVWIINISWWFLCS